MAPGNATAPGFSALTSAYSASHQFSKSTSGVESVRTSTLSVNIKETHVGPEYRHWNVFLFKLDAIRIQMGSPVTVKEVRNIGNNGLYDLLLSCWIKLGIWR